MAPLRDIAMLLATFDIIIEARWIPTKANELADDLSRFRYQKIANAFPQLRYLATAPQSWDETHRVTGTNRPVCLETRLGYSGGDSPLKHAKPTLPQ